MDEPRRSRPSTPPRSRSTRRHSERRAPPRPVAVAINDESTRARVVDAAIECILDEGFYRASSNKIAKRAGVTWGVIQYHFGTREALMLAVHERGLHELDSALADAVIEGDSVEARVGRPSSMRSGRTTSVPSSWRTCRWCST